MKGAGESDNPFAMTPEEVDAFLAVPRFAAVSTLRKSGAPIIAVLGFEWDGEAINLSWLAGDEQGCRGIVAVPAPNGLNTGLRTLRAAEKDSGEAIARAVLHHGVDGRSPSGLLPAWLAQRSARAPAIRG